MKHPRKESNPPLYNPSFHQVAAVSLELSLFKKLDYFIPEDIASTIFIGAYVEVSLRGKTQRGFIVEIKKTSDYPRLQPIQRLIYSTPLLTQDLFQMALWMSRYYIAPLGKVLKVMLPKGVRNNTQIKQQLYVRRAHSLEETRLLCETMRLKTPAQADALEVMLKVKKGLLLSELLEKAQVSSSCVKALANKGILHLDIVRIDQSPLVQEEYFRTKPKKLKEEQEQALEKILDSLNQSHFATHLLFGITGSGKTEIYLQAIQKSLALGKGAIMLVPEISLTSQTVERFKSRFEEEICVLHHRLSDGERWEAWNKILQGQCRIVIGARSAVFSPVQNLGLILVDEEHEMSYKQNEESPCYSARDAAVMRGKITGSTVVLGSATPSLESYHNALSGKYILSKLSSRVERNPLPQVEIVDMRKEWEKSKGKTPFSDTLLKKIEDRLHKGDQCLLFLNRRGFHTILTCLSCSHCIGCPHCDSSLTFHFTDNSLVCHLCGFVQPPPLQCPSCHSKEMMKFRGIGTEKLEAALHAIFPDIRTIRLDADTTRHKGKMQQLLTQFKTGKADVLIGTQMIAKGLHFPAVTLVGVINSDSSINIPDFRASEVAFQLITQVAGRAGRGSIPGEVIIQTSLPENSIIQYAARQNYEHFFQEEIGVRQMFGYPPFSHFVKIQFSGKDAEKTQHAAENYKKYLVKALSQEFICYPVVPAGHAKVKDTFRFQFLIRGPSAYNVHDAVDSVESTLCLPSTIKKFIDVDPSSTLF